MKRNATGKRILAFFLTLMMLVGALPTVALAAEIDELPEAIPAEAVEEERVQTEETIPEEASTLVEEEQPETAVVEEEPEAAAVEESEGVVEEEPEEVVEEEGGVEMAAAAEAPEIIDGVYQIGTLEQLTWFRDQVNTSANVAASDAILTADIDM